VPASPRVGVQQVDRIGSCDKRSIVMFGRSADKQKNEGRRPKDQKKVPVIIWSECIGMIILVAWLC
jgi:hypothetical protein